MIYDFELRKMMRYAFKPMLVRIRNPHGINQWRQVITIEKKDDNEIYLSFTHQQLAVSGEAERRRRMIRHYYHVFIKSINFSSYSYIGIVLLVQEFMYSKGKGYKNKHTVGDIPFSNLLSGKD